ncbi:amidohydrolase family-domain-containing protein [Fusarium oxysporum f. sp. albedinis]|nr:amidohydrolase family-domain-containing protein [Fusarium oxysporum f. sp. albedinis]
MARGLFTLYPSGLVFYNGNIYTMCPSNSMVTAMAVRKGKIEYVGNKKTANQYIGKKSKCDLSYHTLPVAHVLEHIQGCLNSDTGKTDDGWLEVVNMDYAGLVEKSGIVGKAQLDKLETSRPIIICSSDYHTVVANSRALDLSGIDSSTKDPSDGKIVRLPGSQEPLENLQAGRAALKLLREAGITTYQEVAAGEEHYTVFSTIKAEGGLSARAYFGYLIEAPKALDAVVNLVNTVPTLKWQAIKAFIHGVITYPANTAALIDPYWAPVNGSELNGSWAPDKNSLNDPYWKLAILTKTLELLLLRGFDAQLHVDGDFAKFPRKDFRLGLAHDELSHEKDWSRFAKLGVDHIVSYQWSQLSSFYIPNTFKSLADYRLDNLQAWAEFEAAGCPLVYGSDGPIDPIDEFLALKVAVTRSGDPETPNSPASQGPPYDGVFPGSGISRKSALQSITINGARFLRADKQIGSLEVGKLADIIVLENNFFKVPEEKLGRQKVLLTMVGGEVLYIADGHSFGVKAKFPNDDKASAQLARRTIGFFNAKELSKRGQADAAKLRKRGACVHKH